MGRTKKIFKKIVDNIPFVMAGTATGATIRELCNGNSDAAFWAGMCALAWMCIAIESKTK